MTLIDRYILAVTQHLPEAIREEVGLELRSNILDMLPDNPDESSIIKILENMGNPSDLAMEYHPQKKYLIGPSIYPKYIQILKLVLSIVAIAFTGIACLNWFVSTPTAIQDFDLTKFISSTIAIVFDGLLQALVWVTVIFIIIDRSKISEGQPAFKSRSWRIEDLEPIVASTSKISRTETIVGICFNLFFATFVSLSPNALPLVFTRHGNTTIIPLLDSERFKLYIPFLIALFLVSAAFGIYKLVKERWTKNMAIFNGLLNAFSIVLLLIMIQDVALLSADSQAFLSEHSSGQWPQISLMIGWIIYSIIAIWDTISIFRKKI